MQFIRFWLRCFARAVRPSFHTADFILLIVPILVGAIAAMFGYEVVVQLPFWLTGLAVFVMVFLIRMLLVAPYEFYLDQKKTIETETSTDSDTSKTIRPNRISMIEFLGVSEVAGWTIVEPASQIIELTKAINQAAADGEITLWGRPVLYNQVDEYTMHQRLRPINKDHWYDYEFEWISAVDLKSDTLEITGISTDNLWARSESRAEGYLSVGFADLHVSSESGISWLQKLSIPQRRISPPIESVTTPTTPATIPCRIPLIDLRRVAEKRGWNFGENSLEALDLSDALREAGLNGVLTFWGRREKDETENLLRRKPIYPIQPDHWEEYEIDGAMIIDNQDNFYVTTCQKHGGAIGYWDLHVDRAAMGDWLETEAAKFKGRNVD